MSWKTIATINKLTSTPYKENNSKIFDSIEEKKAYEEQLISAYKNNVLKSERLKGEAQKLIKRAAAANK